jgi:8-oxo-dGTP diphosphatase
MSKKSITLTVDGIVILPSETEVKDVLLIRRNNSPFKNHLALPGGIVEYGESTEKAVVREVREETSLEVQIKRLVGVYSDPGRDPRGHFVTIAYLCTPVGGKLKAGDDAQEALTTEFTNENLCQLGPQLAFDHQQILMDVLIGYNNRKEA